jgi:addiction module HigA family antidote
MVRDRHVASVVFLGRRRQVNRDRLSVAKGNIITTKKIMSKKQLKPVHPGEVILEEFLKPMKLSQNRLALDIGVPPRRINEIVSGKRRVTADTALRLGLYFHMSPQFWLGLQMDYDLDVTADALASRLNREVKRHALAA